MEDQLVAHQMLITEVMLEPEVKEAKILSI
jgi:hypothetical protein